MAFQSDYGAKRTWDSVTGWELFDVTRPPDYPSYELRRAGSETLYFWCETLSLERVEGATPLGHPHFAKTVLAHMMAPLHPSETERRLIYEALYAFGARHNGPSGPLKLVWAGDKS